MNSLSYHKKINKRSQLTLFAILGLLLVTMVSFFILTRDVKLEGEIEQVEIPEAPIGSDAISGFVQDCVEDSLAKGLGIMSLQGGYIYIPDNLQTLEVTDPEGKKVVEENKRKKVSYENGKNRVPYWLLSYKPDFLTPDYMIDELERYIKEDSTLCIDDFRLFKDQGYDIQYEDMDVDVELDEVVIADVNFPIKARKLDEEISAERFKAVAPVDLGIIAETAINIAANEAFSAFIEDATNNLISLYSGIDENKLPPLAATVTNTDCDFVVWDDSSVKENLKKVLKQGMGYLKIEGTDIETVEPGMMESFVYDTGINLSDIEIRFEYRPEEWDLIDYDVKPKTGPGINRPDKIASPDFKYIPNFCTYKYRYMYDLEYPVLVTIIDHSSAKIDPLSNSYQEKGYSLSIPLWIVLNGNKARVDTGKPSYLEAGFEVNQSLVDETGYVDTHFCDEDQRLSENITLDMGEEKVSVYYLCANSNNRCYIGSTGEEGKLTARFPLCYNGIISFSRSGYSDKEEILTTFGLEESAIGYDLIKKNTLNYSVKVARLFDFIESYKKGNVYSSFKELESKEKAMITMKGEDTEYFFYPSVDDQWDIAPGDYNIDIEFLSKLNIGSSVIEGQLIEPSEEGTMEGVMPNGELKNIPFSFTDDDDLKTIEFFAVAENSQGGSIEVADFIGESILSEQGIKAELLYDNCSQPNKLISIDDTENIDFKDGECRRAEMLEISKSDLNKIVRPIIR